MTGRKERFSGFPAGRLQAVSLPTLFFSELLPAIDDLAELKVTLHVFWRIAERKRQVGGVALRELCKDNVLLQALPAGAEPALAMLNAALRHAVERGSLLRLKTDQGADDVEEWYFLNTESGRVLLDRVRRGEIDLGGAVLPDEVAIPEDRANIFILYEQNIGLLQPLIAEELAEAENLYPAHWIEEAFKLAVDRNVRNWRYIRAILERWQAEGKGNEEFGRDYREDGRSYLTGKYADFIKH